MEVVRAKEYIASISGTTTHPSVEQFNDKLSKIYLNRNRFIKTKQSQRRKSHNISYKVNKLDKK